MFYKHSNYEPPLLSFSNSNRIKPESDYLVHVVNSHSSLWNDYQSYQYYFHSLFSVLLNNSANAWLIVLFDNQEAIVMN